MKKYYMTAAANVKVITRDYKGLLLLVLGNGLGLVLLYWLWRALYLNNPTRAGINFQTAVVYIISAQMLFAILQNYTDWRFAREIRSGLVAHHLLQPMPLTLRYLSLACGRIVIQAVVLGPLYAMFFFVSDIPFPDLNWQYVLPSLLLSFVLIFCVDFMVGLVGFFLSDLWGVIASKDALLLFFGGAFLPMSFYPAAIQTVMQWLPFRHFYQTPLLYLTGGFTEGNQLISQTVWTLLFIALALGASRYTKRRLVVMGA